MEATANIISEKQLVQEFSAIEGIELEPSDKLLLHSFVEEVQAAGGLNVRELSMLQPTQVGGLFHYCCRTTFTMFTASLIDFRDFKALRHTCISALSRRKRIKNQCSVYRTAEPDKKQLLTLMLNRAIPELKD